MQLIFDAPMLSGTKVHLLGKRIHQTADKEAVRDVFFAVSVYFSFHPNQAVTVFPILRLL